MLPAVVARELDVALVDSWLTMPLRLPAGITHTLVYRDVVYVALPATHPLAGRTHVGLDEVADMSWSTWDKNTVFHDWLVQTLRREGVEPKVQYAVPEFATQLEFVAHGLAAAMVPELARVWVPPTVALLPTRPRIEREIYALCRADNNRPAVRVGIDTLQQTFAAMRPTGGELSAGMIRNIVVGRLRPAQDETARVRAPGVQFELR